GELFAAGAAAQLPGRPVFSPSLSCDRADPVCAGGRASAGAVHALLIRFFLHADAATGAASSAILRHRFVWKGDVMELAFPWPISQGEWLAWSSAAITALWGLILLLAPRIAARILRLQAAPDHPEAIGE